MNDGSDQPLIFDKSAPTAYRAGWMLLTILSWGLFLYLLLPGVTSFVLAASGKLSNPAQLVALLGDATLDGFISIGRASGGALALMVGCTSADRLFRRIQPPKSSTRTRLGASMVPLPLTTAAPLLASGAVAEEAGLDLKQLAAIQQAQRMIVHHDDSGRLVAVTMLTDQSFAQAMQQVSLPMVQETVRQRVRKRRDKAKYR